MGPRSHLRTGFFRWKNHRFLYSLPGWIFLGIVFGFAATALVPQALAQTTNTLTLKVVSAGANPVTISTYKYLINIDNTGTTSQRNADPGSGCSTSDPDYPASCAWVSIAGVAGSSPIYTQGDQADFDLFLLRSAVYSEDAGFVPVEHELCFIVL